MFFWQWSSTSYQLTGDEEGNTPIGETFSPSMQWLMLNLSRYNSYSASNPLLIAHVARIMSRIVKERCLHVAIKLLWLRYIREAHFLPRDLVNPRISIRIIGTSNTINSRAFDDLLRIFADFIPSSSREWPAQTLRWPSASSGTFMPKPLCQWEIKS
jgi:hypothetical protein